MRQWDGPRLWRLKVRRAAKQSYVEFTDEEGGLRSLISAAGGQSRRRNAVTDELADLARSRPGLSKPALVQKRAELLGYA